ncbi:MAG: type II toxin-antitoxin system VapC family toxin [Luteolibacter sp.]
MNVLLDTCCFLWLAFDKGKLSQVATGIINDESNDLFLSDVSLWEITLKNTAGKLPLPTPPSEWLTSRRRFFGATALPIHESAIFLTSGLPLVHSDPFDRLIAAQAIDNNLTILSPDQPLSLLGASRIW